MIKKIFIQFDIYILVCALVFLGCDKGSNEPIIYNVTFTTLDVDPTTLGYQGGQITFTMNATWTENTNTADAIFLVSRNNSSNCRAWDWEDPITKGVNYIHNIYTSDFYVGCNTNGSEYTITVIIGQAPEGRVTFHWSEGISNNVAIVDKAREMLNGCPPFYEPPSLYNGGLSNILNNTGSVAWTSQGLTNNNQNETRLSYICRLNVAKQNNPTNWFGNLCTSTNNCNNTSSNHSGFPFPYPFDTYYNYFDSNCNGGFVCYAFIYAAAKAAGYSLTDLWPINSDQFLLFPEVSQINRQIGDIVVFDLDNQFSNGMRYDHSAIISVLNTDIKKDKVISTFGIDQHFKFGGKEIELWGFHSTNAGGIFNPVIWPASYDVWGLGQIKIIRLE